MSTKLFILLGFLWGFGSCIQETQYTDMCNACIYNNFTFCLMDYNCYAGAFTCQYPKTQQTDCKYKSEQTNCTNFNATTQILNGTAVNFTNWLGPDSQCYFSFFGDGSNNQLVSMTLTNFTSNLRFMYGVLNEPFNNVSYLPYAENQTQITINASEIITYDLLVFNLGLSSEGFNVSFAGPFIKVSQAFLISPGTMLLAMAILFNLLIAC